MAAGLFGLVEGGTIENIKLEDVDIQGNDSVESGAAAVAGVVRDGATINNCGVTGTVKGVYAGGVAGVLDDSTVKNCTFSGNIEGAVGGGITGTIGSSCTIESCTASGNVLGTLAGGVAGGGFFGPGGTTVKNCAFSGNVSGQVCAGGVIGLNFDTVENCSASGPVNSEGVTIPDIPPGAGGVVGVNEEGAVKNCYATGKVSGADYVGGVVGFNYRGAVQNCYATGEVSGNFDVGGVAGLNDDASVSDCYATGKVSGSVANVGGVVGFNNGLLRRCYASGSVFGNATVGGVAGFSNYSGGARVIACVATGDEVRATTLSAGRVIGFRNDSGPEDANFANSAMLVNGATESSSDTASMHGANVAAGTNAGQFNNQTFWSETVGFYFGPADSWKWDDSRNLPGLK